jgi:hypothetical protein
VGTTLKWISHIIWAKPLKPFLQLKEQVPFKFRNKISAIQCERQTFQLTPLPIHVNFRWKVILIYFAKKLRKNILFTVDTSRYQIPCIHLVVSI